MNERIAELMRQTGVPVSIPFDKWCEKFAGLIVAECVNVISQQERVPPGFFFSKPAHQHVLALKDHFGIKDE